ncbi:hypothetical protein K2Q00_01135 [Patescibacteria group bacterium]|nr:hypothetical protein [Patescibacteria group bacterium]
MTRDEALHTVVLSSLWPEEIRDQKSAEAYFNRLPDEALIASAQKILAAHTRHFKAWEKFGNENRNLPLEEMVRKFLSEVVRKDPERTADLQLIQGIWRNPKPPNPFLSPASQQV